MSGNFRANADAAVAALMGWYNTASGLWDTTGWWNSANALEAVIDYSLRTNTTTYQDLISNTFLKNKDFNPFRLINVNANFLNGYYDDEGWWALAWIKAYDLIGIGDYLNMAETIFADMTKGWDQFCQGGIMWKKWDGPLWKEFKNAIANELFLTVAARLYQRTSNQSYLNWAQKEWNWFSTSGMIGQQTDPSKNQVKNMINDGLDQTTCASSGSFYTYNQGVIPGWQTYIRLLVTRPCSARPGPLPTPFSILSTTLTPTPGS
jgi:predicted alpha-1,6-mannanase (GH76 family)